MKISIIIAFIIVGVLLYGSRYKIGELEIRVAVLEQQLNSIQYQLSGDVTWLDTTIKHISPKVHK